MVKIVFRLFSIVAFGILTHYSALAQAAMDILEDEIMATGKAEAVPSTYLISGHLSENFDLIESYRGLIDESDVECDNERFLDSNYTPTSYEASELKICQTLNKLVELILTIVDKYSEFQFQQDKAKVDRLKSILKHNTLVYSDQRFQTKAIFWVTHAIVVIGFLAALFELRKAHQLRSTGSQLRQAYSQQFVSRITPDKIDAGGNGGAEKSTITGADIDITLGFDRIALKTSINGIAIFVITIFYYLIYITFVYPISNAPHEPEMTKQAVVEQMHDDNEDEEDDD